MNIRLDSSTRTNYSTGFHRWQTFCDFVGYDYFKLNDKIARHFIGYMHAYLDISGDNADKTLTAVKSTLLECNVFYNRSPFVTGLIKGFKIDRPVNPNPTKPLSVYHLRYMIAWCVKKRDFTDWALSCAVLLAFFGMTRPGEVAPRTTTSKFMLTRGQVKFHPNMDNPTDVIVSLYGSKTNRTGKLELISVGCYCKTKMCGVTVPCPLHRVLKYAKARDGLYGYDPKAMFFIKESNGVTVLYNNMHSYLQRVIKTINEKKNLNMILSDYTPHCARIGGTTERARNGERGHNIEQRGRWDFKTWKTVYNNIDWRDISLLSGLSVTSLQMQAPDPFVDA